VNVLDMLPKKLQAEASWLTKIPCVATGWRPSGSSVSPAEALELLKSALALHGYTLVRRAEGTWIVLAERNAHEAVRIKVVPLNDARADELAYTLSMVAPPWVRIVPYYPTNSLIISGHPAAVEELVDIIK
jgi:type II secretory pathway component GspD/PulD (secretin)